nr:cation-translocating P-type ATPase [Synechococcus sp. CS-1328]
MLQVEGMKCGGCVRAVERRLLEQPGVCQASVNLLTRTAWVGLAPGAATDTLPALQASLLGLGFEASPRSSMEALDRRGQREQEHWWRQWRQLVVALLLLLVSGMGHLAMVGGLPERLTTAGAPLAALIEPGVHAVVATVALLGPGRPILLRGLRAALARMPSMDTLVGLGVTSAYCASLVAYLNPSSGWPCFFNEPVMLLGFVLLGRFLEERARQRTGRAIEQLARLQPETALLLLGADPPRPVRVGGLRPGDRVRILPGDRVPVDGVVRDGTSAVDVSSLTGEPLPVQAKAGTQLDAGSLNLEAPLVLEVERSGSDSAISRIVHLVEQAQARKAPIQGLADRVAGRFAGVVLLLAIGTLLFWWQWGAALWPQVLQATSHAGASPHGAHAALGMAADTPFALALQLAIAVLVVACPCALGLATPTAITVGSGLAASRGLLFRGGDAIEVAASLQQVLFDKTGTLTLGRPLVSAVCPLNAPADGAAADRLLQLAASLEQHTRHPLAHALLQEAERRGLALLPVVEARTLSGDGVEGVLVTDGQGLRVRVGRPAWLAAAGVAMTGLDHSVQALERQGASVLAVAEGSVLLGLVAVEDQPRSDALETLEQLRQQRLRLGLLSGDRRSAVSRLGERLGLAAEELAWELRPEQKLERILEARQQGLVAMVGDGINDAPALAAADLGIAVGTGTQIAQDTADLVVLGDRLNGVVEALTIAHRTMATVRANLAWAFGYNLVVLPIAAGALLPGFGIVLTPPLAALLMALSSITVVVNALLLSPYIRP